MFFNYNFVKVNKNSNSNEKTITILLGLISMISFSQKKWTLQECEEYAVENNLQVIANKHKKSLQDANLKMSQNEYLPTVGVNIGNSMNFGQTQSFQGSIGRNDNFNNSANIGVNVLIYNGNRVAKNIRKTKYDVEALQYDLETVKNNILLQIVQQYLAVMLNRDFENQ